MVAKDRASSEGLSRIHYWQGLYGWGQEGGQREKKERGSETKGERVCECPSMADLDHPKRPPDGGDLTMGFNHAGRKFSHRSRCEAQPPSPTMTKQASLGCQDNGSYRYTQCLSNFSLHVNPLWSSLKCSC